MMLLLTEILAVVILFVLVIGFTLMVYYSVFYAPFVPTPYRIVKQMIEAANLKKGDIIYDLGCGDARIPIECAKKGATAYGVDVAWPVYFIAKANIWFQRSKAKVLRKNFFQLPLGEARVIFCYLWPTIMEKLAPKFARELSKGSLIISYSFPITKWKPVEKIPTIPGNTRSFQIYVYEIGKSDT